MKKTYYPKTDDVSRDWILVDAKDQNLGRLASKIATLILGKHKPQFTPGVNMGDFVIVINAEKIKVTGKKMEQKKYYRVSGYPDGLKEINLRDLLATNPERVIKQAVKGMLPHNRLGRKQRKQLRVYVGPNHPHQAQKPTPIEEVLP